MIIDNQNLGLVFAGINYSTSLPISAGWGGSPIQQQSAPVAAQSAPAAPASSPTMPAQGPVVSAPLAPSSAGGPASMQLSPSVSAPAMVYNSPAVDTSSTQPLFNPDGSKVATPPADGGLWLLLAAIAAIVASN
jgi:hypothetical protein